QACCLYDFLERMNVMKNLLLTSVAAGLMLAGSAYANDMPATRSAAIEKYQDKIQKLRGMSDAEYANWRKDKTAKYRSGKHSDRARTVHMTDDNVGTKDA